jgi:drug/metabolite transporter (DMT)-like permease
MIMHLFRVSRDDDALRGALLMTGAAILFAAMAVLIRYITREVHPFEAAFFRNLFGLIPMIPWMLRDRLVGLRTLKLKLHFIRAVIGLAGMLCLFSALAIAPAAQVIAINFTVPILTTILAALILHETVRARRWTAVALGFIGAMIIVRPIGQTLETGAILALLATLFTAFAVTTVKMLFSFGKIRHGNSLGYFLQSLFWRLRDNSFLCAPIARPTSPMSWPSISCVCHLSRPLPSSCLVKPSISGPGPGRR